jgi:hypothetical protein
VLLIDNTIEGVKKQLKGCRRVMEERGLKISRKKTIYIVAEKMRIWRM